MALSKFFPSFRSLIALAILLGVASGCRKARQDHSGNLTDVRLGYFANLTHAQAVLGVASGDFAQAVGRVKLSPKIFNAGPSLIEAILSGDIDIGYIGPGPTITAWSKTHGQEIRLISGAAANGVVIVAGSKSNIHRMSDLAGRKIASPQRDNTQDISARHYVRDVLKQRDDKNVIPIANAEQAGRMLAGDIDAAWAPEPWGSRLVVETGGTIIEEEKNLWPAGQFTLTVVIVRQEFLDKHPDIVRKILAVHHEWTKKLAASPEKYVPQLESALADLKQKRLAPGVLASALAHVKFTDDPGTSTLNTMAQWSLDLDVVRQPVDLNGLVDTSIVESLK